MKPLADVRVWEVQDRRSNPRFKRPWLVRWTVDGREFVRTHRTRTEADRRRSLLLAAVASGERFNPATGEPVHWSPPPDDPQIHVWAQRWVAEQWDEWQPRTRTSALEALSRFVPLAARSGASTPPGTVRPYLLTMLSPDREHDPTSIDSRWLDDSCAVLSDLNRKMLADVDARLGLGLDGRPLSASTANRYRKVARACVRRAVELELLDIDPWPAAPRGRSQRKAAKERRSVDIRALPDPVTMATAIDAIVSHQPASHMYRVMTAIAYYGGLRPSEVVMLRCRSLTLPAKGWGRIDITEADVSHDEPGEPKTGPRSVPIPPVLVALLTDWLAASDLVDDDLLFRTRTGRRPTASNWLRAWHRALRSIGHPPLRIYDCRHAAATTWLQAGVPMGEVARRLGHSVATLVSTYVGALATEERVANERIESALAVGGHRMPPSGDQP